MTKKANKEIPDNILSLLSAADERHGFPVGTLASVMQQEVGGNLDKYLNDPGAYHYAAGADGRRVAGHTGKVSTAFGPFGILESTAADPGYGVKPLSGKSIEEQIRFAADYLAARSKQAGSLEGGLAGYGEGAKYGQQVMARAGRGATGEKPGTLVASAPDATERPVMEVPLQVGAAVPAPQPTQVVQVAQMPAQLGPDPWEQFLGQLPQNRAPVDVASLSFGNPIRPVDMGRNPRPQPQAVVPNFEAFSGWRGRAA